MWGLALVVIAVDPGVERQLDQARKLLEKDPAAAIVLLDQAARAAADDPIVLARAYLLRGAAYAMTGRGDPAADNYRTALELDPSTRPIDLPARAIAAWDLAGLPPLQPVQVAPAPAPAPAPVVTPAPEIETSPKPRHVWPWLTGAGAVAAGATGLVLGVVARGHADSANQLMDIGVADQTYAQARREALAANVLFGVAGALVIACVVSWLLGP